MTADAGGMLLLALPIPALLSGDGWMATAGEALPIVAAAALFAVIGLVARRLSRRRGPSCSRRRGPS